MESKRKSNRFVCHGSADLTASNGRCWGHLGDISLGGFYVATFTPWPVGTEVSFKLSAENQEIVASGTVATSHPGVGMAIHYKELPAEQKAMLEKVIGSLESAGAGADTEGSLAL